VRAFEHGGGGQGEGSRIALYGITRAAQLGAARRLPALRAVEVS
jgi:hypothetical protein